MKMIAGWIYNPARPTLFKTKKSDAVIEITHDDQVDENTIYID